MDSWQIVAETWYGMVCQQSQRRLVEEMIKFDDGEGQKHNTQTQTNNNQQHTTPKPTNNQQQPRGMIVVSQRWETRTYTFHIRDDPRDKPIIEKGPFVYTEYIRSRL